VGIATACFSLITARLDGSLLLPGSSQHSSIERSDSEFKAFRDRLDEAVTKLSGAAAARDSLRQSMGLFTSHGSPVIRHQFRQSVETLLIMVSERLNVPRELESAHPPVNHTNERDLDTLRL
jgi:hypothetical protein